MRDSILKNFGDDVSFMEFVLSADVPCRSVDANEIRVELKVRGVIVCVDSFAVRDFAKEGNGRVAVLPEQIFEFGDGLRICGIDVFRVGTGALRRRRDDGGCRSVEPKR